MIENNKNNINLDNQILKLDPNFITGLTESEGSFSILFHKSNKAKFNKNVSLRYKITMLKNELELLKMVKSFFNCGVLSQDKNGVIEYGIQDFSSIKSKVLPHFLKYPLRGTKHLDFLSFKEAFDIINSKEHLFEEGLLKLDIISKSMNSYRQFSLANYYFPSHTILNNPDFISLSGHYINGFIAGDGCLALNLSDKNFCRMSLQISQHINNKLLLYSIANYFKSPTKVYKHDKNSLQISLSGFKLWQSIIFEHFSLYPLYGSKLLRLNKLFIIREFIKDNQHLMQVGKYRQWRPEYKLQIKDIWKN